MKKTAAKPTTEKTGTDEVAAVGKLGSALFDIGWRLAITVLVFLVGGHWLDERLHTKPWFSLAGFLLIIASFVLIVRRILQGIPRSQGGLKDE